MRSFCFVLLLLGAWATPLDDYVNAPDPHFSFYDTGISLKGPGWRARILNMTSQMWMGPELSTRGTWWHYLVLIAPDDVVSAKVGALVIADLDNEESHPTEYNQYVIFGSIAATSTGLPTAIVYQVPNEPMYFSFEDPPKHRTEDGITAFLWKYFIEHYPSVPPSHLVEFANVKAAVRGMDAAQTYFSEWLGYELPNWIVTGASKRGWATWLTYAVDRKRVIAAAPMVASLVNTLATIKHYYPSLCGWPFVFTDYWKLNITAMLYDGDLLKPIMDQVDPLVYKARFDRPLYAFMSTGDEFFLPDNSLWWFNQVRDAVPGSPKFVHMMPECEHSELTCLNSIVQSLVGFIHYVLSGQQLRKTPLITWSMEKNGTDLVVHVDPKGLQPTNAKVWYATTLTPRRDFRLLTAKGLQPVFWWSEHLKPQSKGLYVAHKKPPKSGYLGFYVELEFMVDEVKRGNSNSTSAPSNGPFHITTEVSIIPQTYPCGYPPPGDPGVLV